MACPTHIRPGTQVGMVRAAREPLVLWLHVAPVVVAAAAVVGLVAVAVVAAVVRHSAP